MADGEQKFPKLLVPPPPVHEVAQQTYQQLKDSLLWNPKSKAWYEYSAESQTWQPISPQQVKVIIEVSLSESHFKANTTYINQVVRILKEYLKNTNWRTSSSLLPLQNSILDIQSLKTFEHSSQYGLTWRLPYDYDSKATCKPVQDWLLEITQGDKQLVQLLRAYLNAIVTGRTDLQRFLEIVGPGATGKSTFCKLAIALIGLKKTLITSMRLLEGSYTEIGNVKNKKLIYITDSDSYTGKVSALKAITGQDPLRGDSKGEDNFTSEAMVIVAANEPMQSKDYTSGLQRRRITVPFQHYVEPDKRRNLITVSNDAITGEFAPYISGLLNWVLKIKPDEVTKILNNPEIQVQSLGKVKVENIIKSHPLADWLNECIVIDPNSKTHVGNKEKGDSEYLYPSYLKHCRANRLNPVSLRHFSDLLVDLCNGQLGLVGIEKSRDTKGVYIQGLKMREGEADSSQPRPVTQDTVIPREDIPPF